MILTSNSNYKSLAPFEINLPNLTVLTGLNGAGKTQILTLIANGNFLSEAGRNILPIRYISGQTMLPQGESTSTNETAKNQTINAYNQYLFLIKIINRSGFEADTEQAKNLEIYRQIAERSGTDITSISLDQFMKFFPIIIDKDSDIFGHNFAVLFKNYHDKLNNNLYNEFLHKNKGENVEFLSEEDFVKVFGPPPWEVANRILEAANLDYILNKPVSSRFEEPFNLILTNKINGANILFDDLSSGEKVIMSLALALYNVEFGLSFPRVLLMDEPDASLHPIMAKQFIDVVEKVLVRQHNVKVIITTHSPSTVALSPEESIYVVNKIGKKIEKCSKDKALSILTEGIPSFSINYENRRQVFVESKNDVMFYEKIYLKLERYLIPEISLNFISSGDSRTDKNGIPVSNCEQVILITNTLRSAGNNLVWGIIDWDKNASSSDFVKVIGNGSRYAIENYLFDPLLLSALLIREKIITREDLGMNIDETFIDLQNFDTSRLQKVVDFITEKVKGYINPIDNSVAEVELVNGLKVSMPVWYLHYQGHQLEEIIIKAFPKLNSLKRGTEEGLKLEIVNKIIDDIPKLVSKDFLDVFIELQKK